MMEVERTIVLNHGLTEVVDFLADFSNAELWDPGTVSCRPLGHGGEPAVGSEWLNVSEFRGRRTQLRYRLIRRDRRRLIFEGRNRTATTTDDMRFEESPTGTVLSYRARLTFHGLARLVAPLLRREFQRLADEVAASLPDALDRALTRPEPGEGGA
ncbi:SRPBCC family protein [Streptomyces sp. NPDC048002]|uniref:SRPBCC family protein n=1 Tax=Streptomyces sp. NPDC048002 TaxID=3154344 RepID=UPI00340D629F